MISLPVSIILLHLCNPSPPCFTLTRGFNLAAAKTEESQEVPPPVDGEKEKPAEETTTPATQSPRPSEDADKPNEGPGTPLAPGERKRRVARSPFKFSPKQKEHVTAMLRLSPNLVQVFVQPQAIKKIADITLFRRCATIWCLCVLKRMYFGKYTSN